MLQSTLYNDRKHTPDSLKDLILYNFLEQTLSDSYYENMFIRFLQINNYEYINSDTDISEQESSKYDDLYKHSITIKIQYNDIPIIINENVQNELVQKQTHKLATKIQKLMFF